MRSGYRRGPRGGPGTHGPVAGGPPDVAPPSWDGPDVTEGIWIAGHVVHLLALQAVPRAHGDRLERVQHVQFGHGEMRESIDADRIAYHHGIEPPAPARSTGGRAELRAHRTQALGQRLLRFRGQRAVTDTCGVRLHHAEHGIDHGRADARANGGATRRRVRRRDERIGAVIHVEQRPLRSLEEHALPRPEGIPRDPPGIGNERAHTWCQGVQEGHVLVLRGTLLGLEHGEHAVGAGDPLMQEVAQPFAVPQIPHPDATPAVLVFVCRADPPPRRTDALVFLRRTLDELVIGQHQMRAIRNLQAAINRDTAGVQLVHLCQQRLGVEHDAVPDQAAGSLVQDSRRDLMEDELVLALDDRVAGVRTALVSDHQVGLLGQHVHDLPLALVTPLGADYHDTLTLRSEHPPPRTPGKKNAPGAPGASSEAS